MVRFKNILVVQTAGMGNTILLTPALRTLRINFPTAKLTLLTTRKSGFEIVRDPQLVDDVLLTPFLPVRIADLTWQHLLAFLRLILLLRKKAFDLAVLAYPNPGFWYPLACWLASVPTRIGHRYKLLWSRSSHLFLSDFTSISLDRFHECDLNLQLVDILGVDKKVESVWLPVRLKEMPQGNEIRIGVHAGSGDSMKIKRWPLNGYDEVARNLLRRVPNSKLIIFGSGTDPHVFAQTEEEYKDRVVKFVNKLGIEELAREISRCQLFIGNDSGVIHLAAALGCRVVVIFGPTSPGLVAPRSDDRAKISILYEQLPCSPCNVPGSGTFNVTCEYRIDCLQVIKPEQVLKAALVQLEKEFSRIKFEGREANHAKEPEKEEMSDRP